MFRLVKIKSSNEPNLIGKNKYRNCTEFFHRVREVDVVKSITNATEVQRKFSLQVGSGWMPFLGDATVVPGEQPSSTREQKSVSGATTPFSIHHDVLEDLKTAGNSKLTIRNLCKQLGIKPLPTSKPDMIDAVVRANVPYDICASKFFKLGGRSGGVARGFCEHGIVYDMTIEGVG